MCFSPHSPENSFPSTGARAGWAGRGLERRSQPRPPRASPHPGALSLLAKCFLPGHFSEGRRGGHVTVTGLGELPAAPPLRPAGALGRDRRQPAPSWGPAQSQPPAYKATGRSGTAAAPTGRAEPLAPAPLGLCRRRVVACRRGASVCRRLRCRLAPAAAPPVPGETGFGAAAMSMGLEIAGTSLAVLGWLCTIVCCATHVARDGLHRQQHHPTAQITWEGLWMNCVVQRAHRPMQCKVYDSLLALPGPAGRPAPHRRRHPTGRLQAFSWRSWAPSAPTACRTTRPRPRSPSWRACSSCWPPC